MIQERTWSELVTRAQEGQEESLNLLAGKARGRLCAYIYRITLDYDLSQDLSQEVLLQMVKSINRLNDSERFWPWLYRITQNKVNQHFKTRFKKVPAFGSAFYEDFISRRAHYYQENGLRQLVQKELSKKVVTAMKKLKQQYRAVLSLRCFDQLPYSDIAVVMDCSEVRARVLFFRAKQALKRQLSSEGLDKGALLAGLGLFGRLTAPAEASSAVSVTAASTKVSMTTALIASASSKVGIATITVVIAGLVGVGIISSLSKQPLSQPGPSLPGRAGVQSIMYTAQLEDNSPDAAGSLSKGAYEQWFYFPEGIDGPMFMRMQRWTAEQDAKLCAWLQDGQANYYYDSGGNQVYIHSYRVCWSNLKVRRLPTDTAEFTEFLSDVEGDLLGFYEYTRNEDTELLAKTVDFRFTNAPEFQTDYVYNTLRPEQFQYSWSDDFPVIDERDQMRKRGWTYFRIGGEISGKVISGLGRIPFVYDACDEKPAWMSLKIGSEREIIDCKDGALIRRGDGTLIASYPSGTFFKGLGRPWMGMHTLDNVRRDAVEQRVWFESEYTENKENVVVTIFSGEEIGSIKLLYTIDVENDIIESIRFEAEDKTKGLLIFSYLQDIEQIGDEFVEPNVSDVPQSPVKETPGMLWLMQLVEGKLGK